MKNGGKENPRKQRKTDRLTTVILVLILIAGVCLLLYPSVSDYWNSFHQTRAIATYAEEVAGLDEDRYEAVWQAAKEYNAALLQRENHFILTDGQKADYEQQLDVSGVGVMGYVEIPSIKCSLPIYHGTDEAVLQIAVGHLEWSSLPTGGESTHCVLSGHRGLPSARLFTDLDKLETGDVFMLRVLDEVLTYEVDQILIVEPQETQALQIVEGEDYCTLVTCTPYGVNTHRLLVRGHRIENLADSASVRVTADAVQIEPLLVAPVVAIPMLLILLIVLLIPRKPRNRNGDDPFEEQA
ncbi:MAG: class C sortase [Oscillospiraceae bacterium]|nr:class C sortase [Oscillospiraceae bacterium]